MSRNDPRAPRLPDPRSNPFAKARHALRMTQADFCRYIGVSLRSGAGFERGERTPPRHLALLCEYIVRYGPLQLPGDGEEPGVGMEARPEAASQPESYRGERTPEEREAEERAQPAGHRYGEP